jgi:spore germination protein KA
MNYGESSGKATSNINRSSNGEGYSLTKSIVDNVKLIKEIFHNDATLNFRYFVNQHNNNIKCCIIFILGTVDLHIINEAIIQPIIRNEGLHMNNDMVNYLKNHVISSSGIRKENNIDSLISALLNGDTILFTDGFQEALSIDTKNYQGRAVEEPEAEKIMRGPRERFTESIFLNLSLIRKRIKTPNLKFELKEIGEITNTKLCICYIQGIANEEVLSEVHKRLNDINIDGLLDSGYIQELIKDAPSSPFETVGSTERPDIVAGKLLEGRIAILLDGSPTALTVPHLFIEYFQSNEDYYLNFYFASINRMLRFIAFFMTTSVPAIYIALITYHQEAIPTALLLSIYAARQAIPIPSIIEALGMLLVFEMLRETGTRMPVIIGQALSIVGALVLGQAAVEARLVSAPMVIIVALSGINGLMIPKLKGALITVRILLLLLCSLAGFYGYIFGVALLLIHLLKMRSFGMQYMQQISISNPQSLKDSAIRSPWWLMIYRPKCISPERLKRQGKDGNGL